MRQITRFVQTAVLVALSATAVAGPALPSATLQSPIAAQSLAKALQTWAQQSGVQVMYAANLASGLQSQSVPAGLSAGEALEKLLAGTGLRFRVLNERTVSVIREGSPTADLTSRADSRSGNENDGRVMRLAQADAPSSQQNENSSASASTDAAGEQVTDVLVSARKMEQTLPQELSQYGNRVSVIDAKEIERRGIMDISQALQAMAPSMYIQSRAGAFDYVDVSLQGSRTSEVLWLVDGVRVTNRLYNGNTPLDTLPASMVERIEVLEGGQGLFYGTQSVAGVINIITKSFSRETDGQLGLGMDSNDGRHASGYLRGAAGRHEYVLYASSDDTDGFQPIPTEDYQPSATHRKRIYDVQTYGAKYGVDLGDRVRFSAGYQYTHAPQLDAVLGTKIAQYYNERKEGLANIKFDWDVTDNFGFYVKLYDHKWDSYVTRVENSITAPGTQVDIAHGAFWGYKDYGLNALAKYVPRKGGTEFYFGYDFQNYSGQDTFLLIDEQTETVGAYIFQVRSGELFRKLKLAGGLRYNDPKDGQQLTVWNVSANYAISDSLFVRTNIGTAYRLPDAEQLYAKDPCCTRGNSSLAGEKSKNINLSIGGTLPLASDVLRWELIGFARDVENLISGIDDGTGVLVYQNSNQKSEVRGWMANLQLPLGSEFDAGLSYSKTDATLGASNAQIDRIPKYTASAILNYRSNALPIGGAINVNSRGDMFQNLPGGLGRQAFGKSTTADVSAYFEFGRDGHHRVIARVQNITDETPITRMQREFIDGTRTSYPVHILGLPRTYSLAYSFDF